MLGIKWKAFVFLYVTDAYWPVRSVRCRLLAKSVIDPMMTGEDWLVFQYVTRVRGVELFSISVFKGNRHAGH